MSRNKDSWLKPGAGDLKTATVEDVPVKGESVEVRALPAEYSNDAQSQALEMVTGRRGEQTARVNTAKLEKLQFAHGVVDPKFSAEEVDQIAKTFGPAFKKVIAKIDELSGVDKEAIENVDAKFPAGGADEAGSDVGDGSTGGGS